MKYFRSYSWWAQFLLFLFLVCVFLFFAGFSMERLLPKIFGISITQIESINDKSPHYLIDAALIAQAFSSIIIFMLTGFLFAYLAHPRPFEYLGLKKAKPMHLLLVLLIMAGAMPILQMIETLVSQINFGESVKRSQEESESMMRAFLTMPDTMTFVKVFCIMAVIPAAGEEIFFRGVLMRLMKKSLPGIHYLVSVISTAVVFALMHSNPYGLLSIFLAGILLGSIYYITGSLWCNILAHLFFNGSQVLLVYLSDSRPGLKKFLEADDPRMLVPYLLIGVVVFGASLYALIRTKTPLPADWPQDFNTFELTTLEA